jgi:hypothetical protein
MTETTQNESNVATSSTLTIGLAWLVVLVPAAWGVYNTVLRAANLFR